ncbi:beta-ketoacyl synthase N-terminal-like domain-containing protein [Myxococcus sp. AB036A]|uniref:beta-ketoacyl synthase N-terminal-like domain-containing protein n=1 Tax=Myxococcus sp. AB036A TaxID=2562793 RepID=UPI0011470612|nr:beta-ketoacyl synthase N-terminal-like domain-containing protein [Myxococcus sp. AB036A]
MERDGAWIHSMGMTTPVGLRAAASATAIRAGISRLREHDFINRQGRPMILASLPDEVLPALVPELAAQHSLTSRQARMLRLATHALQEAAAPLKEEPLPLLLASPEPTPGRQGPLDAQFLQRLSLQTGIRFAAGTSRLSARGRAAGLELLKPALALLQSRTARAVLVGGVDSHVDAGVLGILDQEGRVHAEEVLDGFVPGEGAGFLLLSAQKILPNSRAIAHVSAPGLGEEQGHRYSEQPYLGDGLADAVRAAVEGASGLPIRTVFASLNGESFGAKEWGVAFIRNREALHPELRMEHPADCFGDLGAATGPVLVGLAALGLKRGHLPGPCLAWCSSETAPRAATLVSRGPMPS